MSYCLLFVVLLFVVLFFALKKTRASGRNVGKVFNPVVKLVLENQPLSDVLLFSVYKVTIHLS